MTSLLPPHEQTPLYPAFAIPAPSLLTLLNSTFSSPSTPPPHPTTKDFLLIDVRRNDHAGGTIFSSLNLPIQTLPDSLPTLYELVVRAGVKRVVWYCGSCTPTGRGTRAAGYFQSYIVSQQLQQQQQQQQPSSTSSIEHEQPTTSSQHQSADQNLEIESLALEGGIKGWVARGGEYVEWMQSYEAETWAQKS